MRSRWIGSMLLTVLAAQAAQSAPAMLYWLEKNDGVFRCELPACTTITEVVDDDTADRALRLDPVGGRLYYVNVPPPEFTSAINSTTLTGADSQEHYRALGVGGVSINDIAVAPEGGGIYYAITGGQWRIRKLVIPGDTLLDVLFFTDGNGNQVPYHLNFDTGVSPSLLYWRAAQTPFEIWRADPVPPPITGLTTPVYTATNLDEPFRLDVDDRRVYYGEAGTIMRAQLPDFTSPETVVMAGSGFQYGIALDLDARMVYWTDVLTSEVRRAPMDPPFGAPQTVLFSQGASMGGVAILPGVPPSVPALGGVGTWVTATLLVGTALFGLSQTPRRRSRIG